MNEKFITQGNISRQAYEIILNFFSDQGNVSQNSELSPFFQQTGKF